MNGREFHGSGISPNGPEGRGGERPGEDTYIPSFSEMAARAGLPAGALAEERISIPTKLFRLLMTLHLRRLPFNSEAYARANPDVAEANKRGEISSLFEHYTGTGWFENRPTGWHFVDKDWYRRQYYDLAAAEKVGKIESLSDHFYRTGRREGRVASANQLAAKQEWDQALKSDS